MKKILFALIFTLGCVCGYTQTRVCCPYIGDITIIPAVPTNMDSIRIATSTTTPGTGRKISYQSIRRGDTFYITGCYVDGAGASPRYFPDTTNVGRLTNGNYAVKYVGILSFDFDTCSLFANDKKTLIKPFTVQNSVGTNETIENQLFSVYPNPANEAVQIQTEQLNSRYQLFNIIGQMVAEQFFDGATNVVLTALPRGEYLLKVSANGQAATKKIVKN
jgi:hypothetical protein